MAAVPPATGVLVGSGAPALELAAVTGPGDGDEGSAGLSIVTVVDLGVSTVPVVLDPGVGTAVVCTWDEPVDAPVDETVGEDPDPDT
jgi:hypothetical protein